MSYESLRIVWWLLIGTLLAGFAIMDGYDLGSAALLPFVARNNDERHAVLHTIDPFWEGNQVWFIVGGAAIFAAWPALYGASFSGFYLAMFLVLVTLILRPGGFQYRDRIENPRWREFWDWALFSGGVVPALVFGVAFGNLFEGVPFTFDSDLRFHSSITLLSLLNPFALLCGLVSLAMIVMHGACWLNLKTVGPVQPRAQKAIILAASLFVVLFALAGAWLTRIPGFAITSAFAPDAPSNPLMKSVTHGGVTWFANYTAHPVLWLAPIITVAGALLALALRRRPTVAFLCSALVPEATIATAGAALFPFMLPSSAAPAASLTVWDASSSKTTLAIMLAAVVVFMPLVIAYTAWAHHMLRGGIDSEITY